MAGILRTGIVLGLTAGIAFAVLGSADRALADGVKLAPYRALYDLSNSTLSQRSGIASITGLMSIGFAGAACEGYTSDNRIVLKILRRNRKHITSDLKSTSYEDGEGLTFRFKSQQLLNGAMSEDIAGRVKLAGPKQEGKGILLRPKPAKFAVPKQTIFPTEYTLKVIEAAQAGKKFYQAFMFDGTERNKTVSTVAFIGKMIPAGTLKPPFKLKGEEILSRLTAWRIDVSYYALDDKRGEQTPNYRAKLLLYENGVVTDMSMEYSDFTLKGELRSLEVSKPPKC